jgi:hypothetical protein
MTTHQQIGAELARAVGAIRTLRQVGTMLAMDHCYVQRIEREALYKVWLRMKKAHSV